MSAVAKSVQAFNNLVIYVAKLKAAHASLAEICDEHVEKDVRDEDAEDQQYVFDQIESDMSTLATFLEELRNTQLAELSTVVHPFYAKKRKLDA